MAMAARFRRQTRDRSTDDTQGPHNQGSVPRSRYAVTTSTVPRHRHAVSLQQAAQESPTLARLSELARESGQRLEAIQGLIPEALRAAVQPGPIDGQTWCLLVHGNAAAAKLRQLLPSLQSRLRSQGWEVNAIRLKVQIDRGS